MAPFIIAGIVILYVGFVVIKRIWAVKNGQYCSCGCEHCSSGCQAMRKEKKEI